MGCCPRTVGDVNLTAPLIEGSEGLRHRIFADADPRTGAWRISGDSRSRRQTLTTFSGFMPSSPSVAVLRERSGSDAIELAQMKEPERLLDEFLQTCTVRQLKLSRQIALNLEGGVEQ